MESFDTPLDHRRVGHELDTSLPRPRAHTICAGFITLWGTVFPCFRLCTSLFCSSTYVMWHLANPYTISVPARRTWGLSVATHSCSVPAAGRDLLASGDQHPLLKLILLCLFSVKGKALFQPVLDCVMFSLATLMPICRGQKCSDF